MLPNYIREVFLILTEFCPLRCSYCYINDRDSYKTMSLNTVEKTLDMFQHKPQVILFGGEPLCALDTIKEIINKYDDRIGSYQISTSGTVNVKELYYDLYLPRKDRFEIQVSWDGFETTRCFTDGSTTGPEVFKNILWLKHKGVPLMVRTVVSEYNIDNMYNVYQTYCTHGLNGDFTIVHSTHKTEEYATKLRKQIRLILRSISHNNTYIPRFMIQLLLNSVSGRKHTSCDIGRYVAVTPEGDVYPCTILSQTGHYSLGNVNTNVDSEVMEELFHAPNECDDCEYNVMCDGGCRYERIMNNDNWKNYLCDFNCNNMKVLFEEFNSFCKENPHIIAKLANQGVSNIQIVTR